MGRVIEGMVYPDGWHYIQTWNGKQIRIDSDSYANLLRAVELWRVQNGAPVNNVNGDVDNQLCGRHSHHCHGEARAVLGEAPVNKAQTFIDKIAAWGRKTLNSAHSQTLVSQDQAVQRGEICARCPRNIRWENSCGGCVAAVKQVLALIRVKVLTEPQQTARLQGCASFKFDCRTAVWLKREALADQPGEDPIHECWNK